VKALLMLIILFPNKLYASYFELLYRSDYKTK